MKRWIAIGLFLIVTSIGLFSQNIWEPVNIPPSATSLGPAAIDSNGVIYLSDTNSGLWTSSNYGATWTAINNGINFTHEYVSSVYVDPKNNNHLIAGTGIIGGFGGTGNCHFYNSTNAGASWTVMGSPPVLCNTWTSTSAAVAWAANGDIVLDTYLAIWRSTDGGVTATAVPNSNYTPIQPKDPFAVGGPNPYGPYAGDIWIGQEDDQTLVTPPMNGVMVSTDNGIHFTNNFNCQPIHCFNHTYFDFNKNGDVFAIEQDFGIRKSTDRGVTWTTVLSYPQFKHGQPFVLGHDLTTNRNLYFSHGSFTGSGTADASVYHSTDQGTTWTPWDSGIPQNLFGIGFLWNPTDGRELAVFRNGGGLYRTVNPVGSTGGTAPTVTSVTPNNGPSVGGTAVTIVGTNYAAGATVTFGGVAATNVVVVSSTQITCTTPANSPGAVTVTVTVGSQSGSQTNGYTYLGAPTVTSVSPNNGTTAGGTAVTITGTNFAAGATVTFGGTAATNVVVVSNTSITCTTPAHAAGAVTVAVTNPGGQSGNLPNGFTYNTAAPTVTSVNPNNGTTAGGTAVTITGTNFVTGATVTFGSGSATSVVVVSSTSITCNTPAGSAGSVTVTVTNPSTQSGNLINGYTYNAPPSTQQPTATLPFVVPSSSYTTGEQALINTAKNLAKNGGCTTLNPAPHVWCVGHSTSSTASGALFVNFGTAPSGGALAGAISAITNNTSVNGEVVVLDSATVNPNGYEGNGPGSVLFNSIGGGACLDNLAEAALNCAILMPPIPRPSGAPKRLFIMSSDYANFPPVGTLAIPNVTEFTNHALEMAPGGWTANVNPGDYARITTHNLNFPLYISTGSDYIDWLGIEVTTQSTSQDRANPPYLTNPDGSLVQTGQTYQLIHLSGNGDSGARVIDISALNGTVAERDTWKQAAEIVGNTDPTLEQDNYWVTNCNYDSLSGPPCGSVLLDPGTTPATFNSSPTRRIYITVNPATTMIQGNTQVTFTWNAKPRPAFLDGTNPAFSIQATLCADSTTSVPPNICVTDAQHGYVDVKPFQPWTVATCQGANKQCYNGGVYSMFLEVYPTGACPQAYPQAQYLPGTEMSACTQHVHYNDILQIAYDHTLTPQFAVACATGTTCLNAGDTFSGQTPWSLMLPMVGNAVPITITGAANQTSWPVGTGTVSAVAQTGANIETLGTPVVTNLTGGVQQITGMSVRWNAGCCRSGYRTSLTVASAIGAQKIETANGATPTSDISVAYKVIAHTGDTSFTPSTTRGINYCGIGNHSTNLVIRGQAITMSCFGVGTHWTHIPNCTTDPCTDKAPNLQNHVNLGADVDIMSHTSVSDTQMNITYWICDGKPHAGCTTGVMADAGAVGNRFVQFWVHGDHGQYLSVNSTPTNQIPCKPAVGDNVDTCFMKAAESAQVGINGTGTGMVLRDGIVSDIVFPTNPGQDTQGIRPDFGIGPILIENNGIVQGTENIMIGGLGNVLSQIQSPRDVTVHNNYLFHGQADRAWGIGLARRRGGVITGACLGTVCTDPVSGGAGQANFVYFTGGNGFSVSSYGVMLQGLTGAYAFLNFKFVVPVAVSATGWNGKYTNADIAQDNTQNGTGTQYAGQVLTPIWPDNNFNVTVSTKPNWEQKAGTRVHIYGNIMDNQFTGVLNSYPGISLKTYCAVANGLPGASSNDIAVHDNLVINARTMFSNESYDTYGNYAQNPGDNQGSMPPLQSRRQVIDNNLWSSNQNEYSPVGIPGCQGASGWSCLDVYPRWNLLQAWSQDMLFTHNTGWLASVAPGGVGGYYYGDYNSVGVFFNSSNTCSTSGILDYEKNVWYLNNVFMHGFGANSGCPPSTWLKPSLSNQVYGNVTSTFSGSANGGVDLVHNYGFTPSNTAVPTFTNQINNTYVNGSSFGGDYTLTGPSAISGWIGPGAANTTDGNTAGVNMARLIATVGNTFTGAPSGTPTITTTSPLPNGAVNEAYSQTLICSGGTAPYTWGYTIGSYTNGISLNTSTGVVSGTPTVAGTQSPTIVCTDSHSVSSAGVVMSLTINPVLSITTLSLPSGAVGTAYSHTVSATGGITPYTWSVLTGAMTTCPTQTNGLCLDPTSGGVTGTPIAAQGQTFTATVTDVGGATANQSLTIVVNPQLVITTASLPDGTVNVPYSQTLTGAGGMTPYTWSVFGGTLCAGLSLNGATISGIPTTVQTCSFTIELDDAIGDVAQKAFTINIQSGTQPLAVPPATYPLGQLNVFYSQPLVATGGVPPYTWTIVQGALPPGLAISGQNIVGTPVQTGGFSFTPQVTDSATPTPANAQPAAPFVITIGCACGSSTGTKVGVSKGAAVK